MPAYNRRFMSGVAYLGPEGTFSHFVASRRFGKRANLIPCASVGEAIERALDDSKIRAVVPVENSSGGPIYDTIDFLIQNRDALEIHEEILLDVRLALLGHKGKPVRKVVSHFVPLQHNRELLRTEFPEAVTQAVSSTAAAALEAARDPHTAALASRTAAEPNKLDVLRFPIPPDVANVTHFMVLGRQHPTTTTREGRWKTALVFTLENDHGSLHKFLGPYARHTVNITRIISRPVQGHPETAIFFLELEGRQSDQPVAQALRLCRKHAQSLKVFGSYPASRKLRS